MSRRRSWWALLTASALAATTLLAPMKGSAYRIADNPAPVEGGDPDDPDAAPIPASQIQTVSKPIVLTIVIQPAPGILIRIPVRASLSKVTHLMSRLAK